MCTVTFLPLANDDFVLTSSRDVGFKREKSDIPKYYEENGVSLFYPKDGKAGGTWIGTSRNNRLICCLNGGFKNHRRKEVYAKSRGLIVKELLIVEDFDSACMEIDLEGIEPFTLVVVSWKEKLEVSEFVWDGQQRHQKKLKPGAFIWSSSTLYNEDMKHMRVNWFKEWMDKNDLSKKNILEFHKTAGIGRPEVDVFMKRDKVGTVSITQVSKSQEHVEMDYEAFD